MAGAARKADEDPQKRHIRHVAEKQTRDRLVTRLWIYGEAEHPYKEKFVQNS